MSKSSEAGKLGEVEIVELIPCPNCGKKLMLLPPNYPLYDVQCTGCSFRAQVKTNNSKPVDIIFGAGWDIMDKVLKSGFMIPHLIVNFKWTEKNHTHQKILLYPFIPKQNLIKRTLSSDAQRANYRMFNYSGLKKLPHFVLYEK
jgi:DNA-directed RNA polymerase subunit RPC12/RpoP